MKIRVIISILDLKNSFFILLLLSFLVSCTDARYSHLQRSSTEKVAAFNTSLKPSVIIASKPAVINLPAFQVTAVENKCTPLPKSITKEIPREECGVISKQKINRVTQNASLYIHENSLPDDSVVIDVLEETEKAERYGKIGMTLGIIGLSSMAAYVGFLFFIPGFIFSALAYYKMKNYDLKVKNRKKIYSGLIINSIGIGALILFAALAFLLLTL